MKTLNPELKFFIPLSLSLGVFSVFFWSSSRYVTYHEHLRENALRTGLKCSVVLDNYLTSQGGIDQTFFKNKALSCLDQIGFPQDELAYRQLKGDQPSIVIEDLQKDLAFWVEQPLITAILRGYIPAALGACLMIMLTNPINFEQ